MNIITIIQPRRHLKAKRLILLSWIVTKKHWIQTRTLLKHGPSGSATLLNISWMAVEFPANATAIFKPLGGMSHTEACKTAYAGRNANPSCQATLVGSLKYNVAMVNKRFPSKNINYYLSTVITLWHPPICMNVACIVPFGNFRTSAPWRQTSINKETCFQRSSPQ